MDADGRPAGLRGIGRDVTAEVREADAQAAALRRAQALETLVRRVRRQVLAPRMLAATLESLPPALGCAGAAVLEMTPSGLPRVTHRHGDDPGPLLEAVSTLLNDDVPSYAEGPGGRSWRCCRIRSAGCRGMRCWPGGRRAAGPSMPTTGTCWPRPRTCSSSRSATRRCSRSWNCGRGRMR